MDHEMKIARDADCLALTTMCHAESNMRHDPFAFWKKNIEGGKDGYGERKAVTPSQII
jgi:hypothetical protein